MSNLGGGVNKNGFTRVRAYVVIGVLLVGAAVAVVVTLVRDSQSDTQAGCPDGATMANITLPSEAKQVKLRVLNGTRTPDLAERVSEEFENRGFRVQDPKDSRTKVKEIAVIQYGPKSVGAAQWIRAFFLGEAKPDYNAARTTEVIDIVIGARYRQLATETEVNQSLAQLSAPKLPPGTCDARNA